MALLLGCNLGNATAMVPLPHLVLISPQLYYAFMQEVDYLAKIPEPLHAKVFPSPPNCGLSLV